MGRYDIKLLDCTLRDGGYINDWRWGFQVAREIIRLLCAANVDIVEVGFLRNVDGYDPDISVCNTIEELNRLLPSASSDTMFSAMAMRSNYDIGKLSPYSGSGVEMIRITAHDYDIEDGMDFAREVKSKGYKLSINPINIMGYSDERLLWMLEQVNDIHPYQFSIVDTFGSMKRRDLDRIVSLADNNLDGDIRIALHLHENMSLSFSLAQNFIDRRMRRPVSVDGSLMGMGRIPGNLSIELIADYLNEYADGSYDIDYMMDAIQDYIEPIKGASKWGYTPAYFLSARFNLHRNYAEHFIKKGDLTNRDINHILSRLDRSKATVFDASYADRVYEEYQNNRIQDSDARGRLKDELMGKTILVVAPGATIATYAAEIENYIKSSHPTVISVNFIPDSIAPEYAFFSNNKRYDGIDGVTCKVIATSNLGKEKADYWIDYNSLSGAFDQGCNSFIMLLKLLKDLKVGKIVAAGADGYGENNRDYYNDILRNPVKHDRRFNLSVVDAIRALKVDVEFLTPSAYNVSV